MVVTKTVHWGNSGTEPTAGVNDNYAVNEQPVAEWDNWFNKATETDVAALITALQNVTTGHDHDGANSKVVDATDVVNTPAGGIAATDVQAAITELDSEKNISSAGTYVGNSTTNRAIPHGLGKTPAFVTFIGYGAAFIMVGACDKMSYTDYGTTATYSVTAADSTNFYVGNPTYYTGSANDAITYTWVAIG